MAAITENSSSVTAFAGKNKVVVIDLDMATGTTGTVTIDELSCVLGVVAQMKAAPTADCAHVKACPNATTATNVISVVLYEDDHATACTQTATDVVLFVVGY
jgi:hypothetical protein